MGGQMNSYDREQVLTHWENNKVESMYDKHLIQAEIDLILSRLQEGSKVLDAGCGEGEGTLAYSKIPNIRIHAADFSETRLSKAKERLNDVENVYFKKVDFVGDYQLDNDYDFVVCQRFLINITDWEIQKKILLNLMGNLKKGSKLIMLEGYLQGTNTLNQLRSLWGLKPIPIQWHNLFFDDTELIPFMEKEGFSIVEEDGLGAYFLLTRGIRPSLQEELNWDCLFNKISSSSEVKKMLGNSVKFSRLKLWVFQK